MRLKWLKRKSNKVIILALLFPATLYAADLPKPECEWQLTESQQILNDPTADFWIFNLPEKLVREGEQTLRGWINLVERYAKRTGFDTSSAQYYAIISLNTAIETGRPPRWIPPELYAPLEFTARSLLSIVRASLPNEGPFDLHAAEVRLERKGGAHYHASWHQDPWSIRVILVIGGPGPFVWPRGASKPFQVRQNQAVVFSGMERAEQIPGVAAGFHTSPIELLPLEPNPWSVPSKYWWGKMHNVIEDRAIFVFDIDHVGQRPNMKLSENRTMISRYRE